MVSLDQRSVQATAKPASTPPILGRELVGFDAVRPKLRDRRVEIVADQIELVEAVGSAMDAELGGGSLKISQPPPLSMQGRSSMSRKNARSASALAEKS